MNKVELLYLYYKIFQKKALIYLFIDMGILHPDEPREKLFDDLTPKEAKKYFEWFLSYVPNTIDYIRNHLRDLGVKWEPDFSIQSLKIIADWLISEINLEEIPIEEIEARIIRENPPEHVAFAMRSNRYKLSKEAGWYFFCTSVYFGEMLKHNVVGNFTWDYVKKPKSDVNINQPILLKNDNPKGKCPVLSVVTNTVINIIRDEHPKDKLVETYQTWARIFSEGPGFLMDNIESELTE